MTPGLRQYVLRCAPALGLFPSRETEVNGWGRLYSLTECSSLCARKTRSME